jgi:RsiW-degrading membrane proteinase PrsW (M82 family)
MILLLVAIAPTIALIFFFLGKDKANPEPPGLLIRTFVLGALSVIPVLFVDGIIESIFDYKSWSDFPRILFTSFIIAAAVEEGGKLMMVRWAIWRNPHFDQRIDGILYGAIGALGFATIENILYVAQGGVEVGIGRAIFAVPGHALDGVAMGFFLSQAKFTPAKRSEYMMLAYFVPVFFHGVYDTLVFTQQSLENPVLKIALFAGFVWFVVKLWKTGLEYIRLHNHDDLNFPLPENINTPAPPIRRPLPPSRVYDRNPRLVWLGYILAVISWIFVPLFTGIWAIVIGSKNMGTKAHGHGVAIIIIAAFGIVIGTLLNLAYALNS